MTGRVHKHTNFKGANASSTNAWLQPRGGAAAGGGASDQFAMAQNALHRKRKRRQALLTREAEAPVDAAVDQMVQALRGGRLRMVDVQTTQEREENELKGLIAAQGDKKTIERLAASIAIRGAAVAAMRADPYTAVVGADSI